MTVELKGSIPANLMPFDADLAIDEAQYRRHLNWLVNANVGGITVNGHAAEVSALSREEWGLALRIAVETVNRRVPVIAGIYAEGDVEAASLAREAEREGAEALLVFPAQAMMFDGAQSMLLRRYTALSEATGLGLVAFIYPAWSRMQLATDTLVQAVERSNVIAIKEWSLDIQNYERNFRAMRGMSKRVAMLSSFSASLLPSLVIGADGILSGHGSVIADLHAELLRLVGGGQLAAARALYERIQILTRAIYCSPMVDMHNRMKQQLAMLGRIDTASAHVRSPLARISDAERNTLRLSLAQADMLHDAKAA